MILFYSLKPSNKVVQLIGVAFLGRSERDPLGPHHIKNKHRALLLGQVKSFVELAIVKAYDFAFGMEPFFSPNPEPTTFFSWHL